MKADDRQARGRRLRARAGRSFPRACRTTARGARRAGRPRDDPGAGARSRTRCSTRTACEEAYLAIADMIDMRMPFTFGHSRAVAALADAAAKHMGLPAVRHSRRPAGRPIRTTSASWRCRSRPGCAPAPLTERETDAAQLHPYHGERALASLGRRRQGRRGAGAAPSRAPRRQRLSPQRAGARPFARRPHPCRRRSLPDRARGAALPARVERRGRGRKAAQRGQGREALPRRGRGGSHLRRPAARRRDAPSGWPG